MLRKLRQIITRKLGLTSKPVCNELVLGEMSNIDPYVDIHAWNVYLGDYSYISGPGRISSMPNTSIRIGKYVSIASGIQIIGALHRSHITNYSLHKLQKDRAITKGKHGKSRGDISIGNDVWIGVNSIILSGVNIGDGAIVGAGAVVTSDVPAYSVVVGVPAKVIKMRFDEEDIRILIKEKWWDWGREKILRNLDSFYDEDVSVTEFFRTAK